ncbi:hypothetical protein CYMTET_51233, partial [Cymbomonas tetramitiformis]
CTCLACGAGGVWVQWLAVPGSGQERGSSSVEAAGLKALLRQEMDAKNALQRELEDLQATLEEERSEHEAGMADLASTLDTERQAKAVYGTKLKQLNDQLEEEIKARDGFARQLDTVKEQLQAEQEAAEEAKEDLEQDLEIAREELEEIRKELEEAQESAERAAAGPAEQEGAGESGKALDALREQLASAQEAARVGQEELKRVQGRLDTLVIDLEATQDELEEAQAERDELREQTGEEERELSEETQEELRALREKAATQASTIEQLKSRLEALPAPARATQNSKTAASDLEEASSERDSEDAKEEDEDLGTRSKNESRKMAAEVSVLNTRLQQQRIAFQAEMRTFKQAAEEKEASQAEELERLRGELDRAQSLPETSKSPSPPRAAPPPPKSPPGPPELSPQSVKPLPEEVPDAEAQASATEEPHTEVAQERHRRVEAEAKLDECLQQLAELHASRLDARVDSPSVDGDEVGRLRVLVHREAAKREAHEHEISDLMDRVQALQAANAKLAAEVEVHERKQLQHAAELGQAASSAFTGGIIRTPPGRSPAGRAEEDGDAARASLELEREQERRRGYEQEVQSLNHIVETMRGEQRQIEAAAQARTRELELELEREREAMDVTGRDLVRVTSQLQRAEADAEEQAREMERERGAHAAASRQRLAEVNRLQHKLDIALKEKQEAQAECAQLTSRLQPELRAKSGLEVRLEQAEADVLQLRASKRDMQQDLNDMRLQVEQELAVNQFCESELADLAGRLQQSEERAAGVTRAEARVQDLEGQLARAKRAQVEVQEEAAQLQSRVQAEEAVAAYTGEELAQAAKARLEAERVAREHTHTLQCELEQVRRAEHAALAARDAAAGEREQLQSQMGIAVDTLNTIEEQQSAMEERLSGYVTTEQALQQQNAALREEIEAAQMRSQELQSRQQEEKAWAALELEARATRAEAAEQERASLNAVLLSERAAKRELEARCGEHENDLKALQESALELDAGYQLELQTLSQETEELQALARVLSKERDKLSVEKEALEAQRAAATKELAAARQQHSREVAALEEELVTEQQRWGAEAARIEAMVSQMDASHTAELQGLREERGVLGLTGAAQGTVAGALAQQQQMQALARDLAKDGQEAQRMMQEAVEELGAGMAELGAQYMRESLACTAEHAQEITVLGERCRELRISAADMRQQLQETAPAKDEVAAAEAGPEEVVRLRQELRALRVDWRAGQRELKGSERQVAQLKASSAESERQLGALLGEHQQALEQMAALQEQGARDQEGSLAARFPAASFLSPTKGHAVGSPERMAVGHSPLAGTPQDMGTARAPLDIASGMSAALEIEDLTARCQELQARVVVLEREAAGGGSVGPRPLAVEVLSRASGTPSPRTPPGHWASSPRSPESWIWTGGKGGEAVSSRSDGSVIEEPGGVDHAVESRSPARVESATAVGAQGEAAFERSPGAPPGGIGIGAEVVQRLQEALEQAHSEADALRARCAELEAACAGAEVSPSPRGNAARREADERQEQAVIAVASSIQAATPRSLRAAGLPVARASPPEAEAGLFAEGGGKEEWHEGNKEEMEGGGRMSPETERTLGALAAMQRKLERVQVQLDGGGDKLTAAAGLRATCAEMQADAEAVRRKVAEHSHHKLQLQAQVAALRARIPEDTDFGNGSEGDASPGVERPSFPRGAQEAGAQAELSSRLLRATLSLNEARAAQHDAEERAAHWEAASASLEQRVARAERLVAEQLLPAPAAAAFRRDQRFQGLLAAVGGAMPRSAPSSPATQWRDEGSGRRMTDDGGGGASGGRSPERRKVLELLGVETVLRRELAELGEQLEREQRISASTEAALSSRLTVVSHELSDSERRLLHEEEAVRELQETLTGPQGGGTVKTAGPQDKAHLLEERQAHLAAVVQEQAEVDEALEHAALEQQCRERQLSRMEAGFRMLSSSKVTLTKTQVGGDTKPPSVRQAREELEATCAKMELLQAARSQAGRERAAVLEELGMMVDRQMTELEAAAMHEALERAEVEAWRMEERAVILANCEMERGAQLEAVTQELALAKLQVHDMEERTARSVSMQSPAREQLSNAQKEALAGQLAAAQAQAQAMRDQMNVLTASKAELTVHLDAARRELEEVKSQAQTMREQAAALTAAKTEQGVQLDAAMLELSEVKAELRAVREQTAVLTSARAEHTTQLERITLQLTEAQAQTQARPPCAHRMQCAHAPPNRTAD